MELESRGCLALQSPTNLLRVFVYGSLKRGCENHQRYCGGYREIHEAAVLGKLYLQPSGYPMLVIPPLEILAIGTEDASEDLNRQIRLAAGSDDCSESPAILDTNTEEDWQWITGEVFSFDDAPERLRSLDFLEDFRPGERCLYHRVIARVRSEGAMSDWTPVWMYIAPEGVLPDGSTRMGTSWP